MLLKTTDHSEFKVYTCTAIISYIAVNTVVYFCIVPFKHLHAMVMYKITYTIIKA